MILLQANRELKMTFDKLIHTMKVPVKWNGIFAVIDNYIILQGEVRSLFFHFDSRKVVTNIIDIPFKIEAVQIIGDNPRVSNVINMILYAFGKWGNITGLKVEKNYAQLNQLFRDIMRELSIEPDYTAEYFRFYKNKVRITYEEVIETALEPVEEIKPEEEKKESGGLWHKLIWKRIQEEFSCEETTLRERRKVRLGNNFYLVGYLCPSCGEKMHMVVYPSDREFRIETEEGGVLLARAFACGNCNCFYTPRPKLLLSEGDAYEMPFGDDRGAFEDYLELLGKNGAQISNYNYNEFVDKRKLEYEHEEPVEEPLEECCAELEDYSDEELWRLTDRMEERFYPDKSVLRNEEKVKKQRKKRGLDWRKRKKLGARRQARSNSVVRDEEEMKLVRTAGGNAEAQRRQEIEEKEERQCRQADAERVEEAFHRGQSGAERRKERDSGKSATGEENRSGQVARQGEVGTESTISMPVKSGSTQSALDTAMDAGHASVQETSETIVNHSADDGEREAVKKKYEAKINVCNRFSERQLGELKRQLAKDTMLAPEERQAYLEQVEEQLIQGKMTRLSEKVDSCEGKSYSAMKKVKVEVEEEDIPRERKLPLLEKLKNWMRKQGAEEVSQLMAKLPASMDKAQYRSFMEKVQSYGEDVDMTPYEESLKDTRQKIETQEIADVVKRARKSSRRDLADLAERLKKGDYLPELVSPYMEKLQTKIRQLDMAALADICRGSASMSYAEGMRAYEQILQGDFLPELKEDALKNLSRRLSRLKSEECELLGRKLKEALRDAGVKENERHHYYPAKRVLDGEATEEETEVIDYALATYAAGRGIFEYPVLVVDTSRNRSGKDGIILTPEHLYYSTLLTSYRIAIDSIEEITASTGLLNRGVYVNQKDGTRTKLPYAVETRELSAYAKALNEFIIYLQEKPESRDLEYLAKEKHETICCFRCGFVYRGGDVCPKCGYQNNG